ncbi:putative HTH-type transcriptional regulator YagI [Maritalea myrionectae]|uniref:Putative HTH-type transcriptional regulator YagI n=1 Tax=Maritalea myrionectae TaxID=454601 RepID=A0A2R4MFN0_9HYPH|nr:IclR family transcriptional regulator [Maritalea myrionectae]AVX04851.1 putative HTH-type transcriptional regulator YagI [Maritalea myrionectae]
MSAEKTADGTVGKALEVLDSVAAYGRPVRFSELQTSSPYPKATLYRLLQTLVRQQMVNLNETDGTYSVGLRLVKLAHAAWETASLAPIARAHVAALAEQVEETVHLAQFEAGQVLYVDKRKSNDQFETLAQVGKVAPAYCTGVGKAMMAFLGPKQLQLALNQQAFHRYTPATLTNADQLQAELEHIRADGVAFDREEHEQGTISIAAPVLTNEGRVIGAISIATSTARKTIDDLNRLKPDLLQAAERIGQEATSWQFPA